MVDEWLNIFRMNWRNIGEKEEGLQRTMSLFTFRQILYASRRGAKLGHETRGKRKRQKDLHLDV